MKFTQLIEELTAYQAIELAEILREFIAIERLLEQHRYGPDGDKILRKARICSAKLREPPWNISIATLSEICDNTTQCLQDIDKWTAPIKQ